MTAWAKPWVCSWVTPLPASKSPCLNLGNEAAGYSQGDNADPVK